MMDNNNDMGNDQVVRLNIQMVFDESKGSIDFVSEEW